MRKRNKTIRWVIPISIVLIFGSTGVLFAENLEEMAQDFIQEGVNQDAVNELFSGPEGTLGERADIMLKNGTITERQYDKVYNNFMNLPAERRQQMKKAYDKGYGDKLYNQVSGAVHDNLNEGSRRDHIKKLREQGLTRDQIHKQLQQKGTRPQHLKDLGVGSDGSVPEKADHAKDINDRRNHKNDIRPHKKDMRDRKKHKRDREDMRAPKKDRRDSKKKFQGRSKENHGQKKGVQNRRSNRNNQSTGSRRGGRSAGGRRR